MSKVYLTQNKSNSEKTTKRHRIETNKMNEEDDERTTKKLKRFYSIENTTNNINKMSSTTRTLCVVQQAHTINSNTYKNTCTQQISLFSILYYHCGLCVFILFSSIFFLLTKFFWLTRKVIEPNGERTTKERRKNEANKKTENKRRIVSKSDIWESWVVYVRWVTKTKCTISIFGYFLFGFLFIVVWQFQLATTRGKKWLTCYCVHLDHCLKMKWIFTYIELNISLYMLNSNCRICFFNCFLRVNGIFFERFRAFWYRIQRVSN